jgi:hypothetical protein
VEETHHGKLSSTNKLVLHFSVDITCRNFIHVPIGKNGDEYTGDVLTLRAFSRNRLSETKLRYAFFYFLLHTQVYRNDE